MKYAFEKFALTCKQCKSLNVEIVDSRGYSPESGSWGDVKFACVDCDNKEVVCEA